ncbi:hypothetical protein BOX15_Mlig026655g2 [Macrostomum lignano]|uniref:NAD-dependent epimerase/dehydratase domain-containing protein n=1 Tax=Macrostomum lignano TaxID=282301 RepID=A0A267H1T7_9PLAT|nr:hypothetical protein BOX15_Mlig026655g2 [Macrostomum lignano]
MSESQGLVLLTGATGFIGSHVAKLLLGDGYSLRVTARNLTSNQNVKVSQLKAALSEYLSDRIEFVEADLLDQTVSWTQLVSGCQYVVHVASSLPERVPKTQAEADVTLRTAIGGTRAIIEAVAATKSVKKLVVTSSVASIAGIMGTRGRIYDETVWFDTNNRPLGLTYETSKTLAEKEAWRLFKDIKNPHFSLVCINPGVVIGPLLAQSTYSTSLTLIRFLLNREAPLLPQVFLPCVDVRDVAKAHLSALKTSGTDGQRVIVNTGTLSLKDIALILHEHLGPLGYRVPLRSAPDMLFRLIGYFRSDVTQLLFGLGCETVYDNSKMRELLRVEPMDLTQSVVDTAHSLIRHGHAALTPQYAAKYPEAEGLSANRY